MENSNDEKLLEIIEAFIKVKEGKLKKQSLKKRFGIGANRYDEMRLNLIKSNHLIHPQAIYTQAEINKLIEGNKELEALFETKKRKAETLNSELDIKETKYPYSPKENVYFFDSEKEHFHHYFRRLEAKLQKEGKLNWNSGLSRFVKRESFIDDIMKLRRGETSQISIFKKYYLTKNELEGALSVLYWHSEKQELPYKFFGLSALEDREMKEGLFIKEKDILLITKKSDIKLELLENPNIKKEELIEDFILAKDDDKAFIHLMEKYNLSLFIQFEAYREHFVKQEGINPRKLYSIDEINSYKWLEAKAKKFKDTKGVQSYKSFYYDDEKEFDEDFNSFFYDDLRKAELEKKQKREDLKNQFKSKTFEFNQEGEEPMKQQKQKKNNPTKKELNNKPKEGEKTMSKSSKLQAIQAINQDTPMNTNITKEQKEELVEKGIYDNKQEEAEAKALKEISENLKEVKEEVKALKEEKEKPKKPSNAGRPKWKNEKEKKTAKTLIYTTQELKEKILKYSEKAKQEGLIASQTGAMSEYITFILEAHFAELEKK